MTHAPGRASVAVMRRATISQLARFGVVGASNTVLSFVVYALALRTGVRYLPAGAGAFAAGGINGFLLNRAWTFGDRGPVLRAGSRYAVVQAVALVANLVLLRIAVAGLGVPHLAAQVVAIGPATLVCFALSRLWVFGAARRDVVSEEPIPDRPDRARARGARRRRHVGRAWRAHGRRPALHGGR